ncbi:hypothetical protein OS493_039538 [Desmophyllum pertusum]|uniref:Uncharacterized protein n=1 Tax=Desmophyllum pertusum TaxID=174260 RepID=A0A9W9Z779_9CNID|nr:hypothetical protein OS493_039538 [Desmophyllum pertusum]
MCPTIGHGLLSDLYPLPWYYYSESDGRALISNHVFPIFKNFSTTATGQGDELCVLSRPNGKNSPGNWSFFLCTRTLARCKLQAEDCQQSICSNHHNEGIQRIPMQIMQATGTLFMLTDNLLDLTHFQNFIFPNIRTYCHWCSILE